MHSLRGEGFDASEDGTGRGTPLVPVGSHWDNQFNPHPTLNQSHNVGGIGAFNQEVFSQRVGGIVPCIPLNMQCATKNGAKSPNGFGVGEDGDPSHTLGANDRHAVAVPYDLFQITAPLNRQSRKDGDPCHTLARDNAAHAAVVTDAPQVGVDLYNHTETGDVAATLGANSGGTNTAGPKVLAFGWQNSPSRGLYAREHYTPTLDRSKTPAVASPTMRVRRFMPVECERLQGFPDDWTLITYRGKPAADGPRYKAIGNSMAVPCMEWIGRRIARCFA